MPLFLMVFLFSGLLRADFIPKQPTQSFVGRISDKVSVEKKEAEKTIKIEKKDLKKTKVAALKSSFVQKTTTLASAKRNASVKTSAKSAAKSSIPTYDNVTINGITSPMFTVARGVSSLPDAGTSIGRYMYTGSGKFLYGHRHSSVFGQLEKLSVGSKVYITIGGKTTSYTVGAVEVVETDRANQLNNRKALFAGRNPFSGGRYSFVLQTCYGQFRADSRTTHVRYIFLN